MSLLPPPSMYFQIKNYIPRKSVRNFAFRAWRNNPQIQSSSFLSVSNECDTILNKCRNTLLKLKHAFSRMTYKAGKVIS